MFPTQARASRLGDLLFRSAATSVLALSAVAGGVLLSGGEAKANNCLFTAGLISTCTQGTPYVDWHETDNGVGAITPTDKQIKFITGPSGGQGDVEWKWLDNNGNGTWGALSDLKVDEWHVDTDFNPDFLGNNPPANPSVLEYIIKLNPSAAPNQYATNLWDVALNATFGGPGSGNSTVVKDIYSVVSGNKGSLLASITCTGFSDGSTTCGPAVNVNPNTDLYIVDTATYGGRSIDSYHNAFRQAPGPLPILGAGAAFGFSRKLRGRIKATRQA